MALGLRLLQTGWNRADEVRGSPDSVRTRRPGKGQEARRGLETGTRFRALRTAAKTTRSEPWKSQPGFFYSLDSRDKCSVCVACLQGLPGWAAHSRPRLCKAR